MLFLAKLLDGIFYNLIDTVYVITSLAYVFISTIFAPFLILFVHALILKYLGGLWALLSLTSLALIFGISFFRHDMELRSAALLRSINNHLLDRENIEKHSLAIHQKKYKGENNE